MTTAVPRWAGLGRAPASSNPNPPDPRHSLGMRNLSRGARTDGRSRSPHHRHGECIPGCASALARPVPPTQLAGMEIVSRRWGRAAVLRHGVSWWIAVAVVASASMAAGRFYNTLFFCIVLTLAVLAAISSSATRQPSAAVILGCRLGCAIPAMETYLMWYQFTTADINLMDELMIALIAHATNMLAAAGLAEVVARDWVPAWSAFRAYLGFMSCNGACSIALTYYVGGAVYPAPGGTAASPTDLLLASMASLLMLVGTRPSIRVRLMEALVVVPLESLCTCRRELAWYINASVDTTGVFLDGALPSTPPESDEDDSDSASRSSLNDDAMLAMYGHYLDG